MWYFLVMDFRVWLKIFVWPKMAPFLPSFVTKMLIMRCITPLFAPRLGENVLIFGYNPKFKHPLRKLTRFLCKKIIDASYF
jgi:hypothetical protein